MEDDDNAPDGMLAYALAIQNPSRDDPNWPLPSFDARDWAEAFCKIAAKNGHPGIDEGWMISWFANALMRGFDEHAMRVSREVAQQPPGQEIALNEIEAAAREFLPAVEALCDWMNGSDISADHANDKPQDYDRLCKAMERMQAALGQSFQ